MNIAIVDHSNCIPDDIMTKSNFKVFLWNAFVTGLQKLGHTTEYLNIASWPVKEMPSAADIFVFWNGQKQARNQRRKFVEKNGRKTICVEHGWFKRKNYFHFSTSGHFGPFAHFANWLGSGEVTREMQDRCSEITGMPWDKIAHRTSKSDGHALVIPQVSGDAQHGDYDYDPFEWTKRTVELIADLQPSRRITIRTHPVARHYKVEEYGFAPEVAEMVTSHKGKLVELDHDLDGAAYLVTYNSNTVHEALLAGVPCYIEGPHLAKSVCNTVNQLGEITIFDENQVANYLARLCQWQWSIDEIREGKVLESLFIEQPTPVISETKIPDDAPTLPEPEIEQDETPEPYPGPYPYEQRTVVELKKMCKAKGIKGADQMKKPMLIESLKNHAIQEGGQTLCEPE